MRPLFVTFEGIDGCGKTTQLARLHERLRAAGVPVLRTREPGGTALGTAIRSLVMQADASVAPLAELLLYVADRAQHLARVVEPALARGETVLCDRFTDATIAYQGYGRGLGASLVASLHRTPPLDRRPDRTVLLDLDPVDALARARRRNHAAPARRAEGRFEEEPLAFHERVRAGYLELASREPERIRVVDARGVEDDVAVRVVAALADLLP